MFLQSPNLRELSGQEPVKVDSRHAPLTLVRVGIASTAYDWLAKRIAHAGFRLSSFLVTIMAPSIDTMKVIVATQEVLCAEWLL